MKICVGNFGNFGGSYLITVCTFILFLFNINFVFTLQNGLRRRTPGGVFLFLLKHHDLLSAEDQKAIFSEDRNIANKKTKTLKASIRDRKVEELKKRLCEQGGELPNLGTRKELMLLGEEANPKPNNGNCKIYQ